PPPSATEQAIALLQSRAGGALLAVDDLGKRHPELAACTADGSGALLLPLGEDSKDAILWFRPELSRTVAWGGNPNEHVTSDPATGRLSPRGSFAAWKEIVSGRSEPWAEADLALARELRTAFERAVAQRTKAELAKLRHYDSLTGLPNRSLLQERLAEAQRDTATGTALLFLDLDRFKAVNDTMGHAAGDALLIEVARRLSNTAGPDHITARLGGDEFVVLCRGLDTNAIADLSEQVRAAIEAPYEIAGRPCHISASIGIAIADQMGSLDLVRAADTAMYAAKQGGGNRGVMFDPSLSDATRQQAALENDMREALGARDPFVLLYQPLFRSVAGTRYLLGFEALLRWQHPRHGCMSPDQFIPQAEKSGLIIPLGELVLARVLRQGHVFRQIRPEADMRMAMNISPLQLVQPGFCSGLAGALEAEAFPPAALSLEVADSILTDPAATSALAELRRLGVRVAIDDFGLGHASHRFLRGLQADEVKLDRRFFDAVTGDARAEVVIGAVIALAHAAGLPVAVEGVETKSEADIALGAGADVVQGFFFSPPLSADAAESFLRTLRHTPLSHQNGMTTG
ncbi:MAG TPA: EAL domain-containing protein, partial [Rhodopila sp.]